MAAICQIFVEKVRKDSATLAMWALIAAILFGVFEIFLPGTTLMWAYLVMWMPFLALEFLILPCLRKDLLKDAPVILFAILLMFIFMLVAIGISTPVDASTVVCPFLVVFLLAFFGGMISAIIIRGEGKLDLRDSLMLNTTMMCEVIGCFAILAIIFVLFGVGTNFLLTNFLLVMPFSFIIAYVVASTMGMLLMQNFIPRKDIKKAPLKKPAKKK